MPAPSLNPSHWDTNLRFAVEKEGGFEAIGLSSTVLASILTSADFMSLFPVGAVMMWADEDTIPENWEIIAGSATRYPLGLAAGGTPLALSGAATHAHADHVVTQPNNHTVTQPTAHGTSITQVDIADTGSGQFVVTAVSLTNNHVGANVNPHAGTAVDPHAAANHSPLSFSIFFIEKVA